MSRLVHFGPRAARSAGAAVQAVPRRAFSDTPTEDAAAKSGASPAAEPAEDFKISRHSIDARKSQTQITDEALARSSLGGRVERLRSYTGVPNWGATTDPVMRETMRRTETEAATKDEKKKAVWNRILSSNEPTDKKAKQLIAAGAPSNVVLNVLHRGKNRIYTVRRDRSNVDAQDYIATARERHMEEFDTSSFDHENSSDPDVLPRQRAFTRDEMHRLLQDVENSTREPKQYDTQLMLPASLFLELDDAVRELAVTHRAARIVADKGSGVVNDRANFGDAYYVELEASRKRAEYAGKADAQRSEGLATTGAGPTGVAAALAANAAAAPLGLNAAATAATATATGAAATAIGAAGAAGVVASAAADTLLYADTRTRSLTGVADFGSLPLSAPTPPRDPRLPDGNAARPFLSVFEEAEERVRAAGVNGILSASPVPIRETVGTITGEGVEFPFRTSDRAEADWAATRPPGVKPEDDPMVRRGASSAAAFAAHGIPEGLSTARTYREACVLLAQPQYSGFVERLSGLPRAEQVEKLAAMAALVQLKLHAPVSGTDQQEVEAAERRAEEATRRRIAENEFPSAVEEEEASLGKPIERGSETAELIRSLARYNQPFDFGYKPGFDPNPDNDHRFGQFSKPVSPDFTLRDARSTLESVMEHDRFAAYYEQPMLDPSGGIEPLGADDQAITFDKLQQGEFRKAARKANDPRFMRVIGGNKLRRFRRGLELYSGIPAHLLDYLDYSALPASDPRRVTHPLAAQLTATIGELRDTVREPAHSAGGDVAAHSDLETGVFAGNAVPSTVIAATAAAREAARLAALGRTADDEAADTLHPQTDTDFDQILIRAEPVLMDLKNVHRHESDFEREIDARRAAAPRYGSVAYDDVRLVDATDGEVDATPGVQSLSPLIAKLYGREARVNTEVAAALGGYSAEQAAALSALHAADPAAAKAAVQAAVDRYTVLSAIAAGSLELPAELLTERGLGRLKALLPPAPDFARTLKAAQALKQGSFSAPSDSAAAPAAAIAAATASADVQFAVPGSLLAGNAPLDAKVMPVVGDGSDALAPPPTGAAPAFATALARATESVKLENLRRMMEARGLDTTGVRARSRAAAAAARAEAVAAAARVSAARATARIADGTTRDLIPFVDPRIYAYNVRVVSTDGEKGQELDPQWADRRSYAGFRKRFWGNPGTDENASSGDRPIHREKMDDDDSLARTLQDPVEYMSNRLSHAQLRALYNHVERRRESAFFGNQLSDAEWAGRYADNQSREAMLGLQGSETEERELMLMRREITTGSMQDMLERRNARHRMADRDTVIYDNDADYAQEPDEMDMHRISRQLQPYEVLPVTDTAAPPYIAIEQQTHLYNLHKLDPATFHPRWIARRLNISPTAVAAMLKAQDLIHKTHIRDRSRKVGRLTRARFPHASDRDDGSGFENTEAMVPNPHDERVPVPRTLDDLQLPYPPETTLNSDELEPYLAVDAPHLIGRVSFEDDTFRDPAWRDERFAPARLVHDADVEAGVSVEKEQDDLNRRWANREQILDAVEKATFARFGPVHWASGRGTLQRPPKQPREVLATNLQPPGRHNWVLTGTDEAYRSVFSLMVRDRDGYLRHPTFREFSLVRQREKDARLPFYWRKYKVAGKMPEVSASYVDQVMLSLARTDGAVHRGASLRELLRPASEHEALSAEERDLARGIDLPEMLFMDRLRGIMSDAEARSDEEISLNDGAGAGAAEGEAPAA